MLSAEQRALLRRIEVAASRLVRNQLAGQYHSVFKGRGMTFAEVREYMPGDELRSIDWNVSARMNRAHVKLFGEERDRSLMLVVDMSASGELGSGQMSKRELAAELAAVLAFSAIANGDRVGLVCFTEEVELFVPPKKGRRHVLRVVREILGFRPRARGTDIESALGYLARIARRRVVAVVVSDFLDEGWERALRRLSKRHELVPVRLRDPLERELPAMGLVTLEDLESGEWVEFDSSGPAGQAYREAARREDERFAQTMRQMRVELLELSTARPYQKELVAYFRRRERLLGGLQ